MRVKFHTDESCGRCGEFCEDNGGALYEVSTNDQFAPICITCGGWVVEKMRGRLIARPLGSTGKFIKNPL